MRAVLIDDETLALDFLESQINKVGGIEIIAKFNHFNIETDSHILDGLDIVFLDIEMPEINGLELAEKVIELNVNLSIVFVTAFNEYAVQAFELNALDYIMKPVRVNRLQKTIERIKGNKRLQNNEIFTDGMLLVNVCNELSFEFKNDNYQIVNWRTTKAKELFLYLLQYREKAIHKSILVDLLWQDMDPAKAYSQLYTAIYHIRKALIPYREYFSIKNIKEGYMLLTNNIQIDIVEWEKNINSSPPLNTETIDYYSTNMNLYSGPYLQQCNYLWTETEQFRLKKIWLKVANQMANFYFEHSKLEKAESWYMKICEYHPEEEAAHFSLMRLYASLGYGVLVDHQYLQLEKNLNELNIKVSPQISNWYHEWRKKRRISL